MPKLSIKGFIFLSIFLFPLKVWAIAQLTLFPGSVVNDTNGLADWQSPSNARFEDNIVSTISINTTSSNNLKATQYGFNLPPQALILGIIVNVRKDSANTDVIKDLVIRLYKAGTLAGNDKSSGSQWAQGTLTYVAYGSCSDLWGTTWSAADINDANFGAAVAAQKGQTGPNVANVDDIKITICFRPTQIFNGTLPSATLR